MFLCVCKGVRFSEAVEAAREGVKTPESLIERFGFEDDECCGRCARNIDALVVLLSGELEDSLHRNRRVFETNAGKSARVPVLS